MQNKLDPRQYTPYALNTPSGNLYFVQNDTSFDCYFLNRPSGDFDFSGSLRLNGGVVHYTDSSNTAGGDNVGVINSTNCFATGQSNLILNSNSSELSGQNNSILGGSDNQITTSDYGTILGGRNSLLFHTGSTLLGDGDNSRQKSSVSANSLTIDFSSGLFIQNNTYVNGSLYVTGQSTQLNDLYITSNSSGTFSGDCQILGTFYNTGSPLQNLQNLKDSSGFLVNLNSSTSGILNTAITGTGFLLNSNIASTGSNLVSFVSAASGALKTEYDLEFSYTIKTTGNQSVAGQKHFSQGVFFEFISGKDIQSTGRFIIGSGRAIPSTRNSVGTSGQISWDTRYLYICTGSSAWARMLITGW